MKILGAIICALFVVGLGSVVPASAAPGSAGAAAVNYTSRAACLKVANRVRADGAVITANCVHIGKIYILNYYYPR